MLIQLDESGCEKQLEICQVLGPEELLGQLTEECGELIQAAQKARWATKGTTPVSLDEASMHLAEECADVALCIDTLVRADLVSGDSVQFIGRYKNGRWFGRIGNKHELASP